MSHISVELSGYHTTYSFKVGAREEYEQIIIVLRKVVQEGKEIMHR